MTNIHRNGLALTMVLLSSCDGSMQLFLFSQRIPDTLNKRSEGTEVAGQARTSWANFGNDVK